MSEDSDAYHATLDALPDHARNDLLLLSGGVKLNGANGHHDAETGEVLQ